MRGRLRVSYFGAGEEEEEGYSDEYTLEDLEVGTSDYVKQEGVPDFRSAWEEMDESTELADSYGLGHRDSMQEAVEAVIAILGMQVMSVSGQAITPCMTCALLVLQNGGISQELHLFGAIFCFQSSPRPLHPHYLLWSVWCSCQSFICIKHFCADAWIKPMSSLSSQGVTWGWMLQVCEGTDAVAPNARSHSALLSGVFIGDATSLVRLKFGIEASTREVAMHVTVRSDTLDISELVHQIIQDA